MSLALGMPASVRGDVADLSEVGARVTTPDMLERNRPVTVDVRNGYSFLFRAQARIVWAAELAVVEDRPTCVHGMLFTFLSPFSRKLIQRLSRVPAPEGERLACRAAESDSDLEALFPEPEAGDERFDLLADPELERLFLAERAAQRELEEGAELSGQLGYFNNTDILQMLEGARATGVLYIEGEGEIHVTHGRICGCYSAHPGRYDEFESVLRLIVADRGRFRFVPSRVESNLTGGRSTTELLLEAQLRVDVSAPLTGDVALWRRGTD